MTSALVAIGGNALVLDGEPGSIPRQQERAAHFADQVADLVGAGWKVLVTHGNGPQVGFILRRGELVANEAPGEGLPELPLWLAVADSQGGIGHMISLALDSTLRERGLPTRAVTLLTHTEVDAADPAFSAPTKPIGGSMSAEVATRHADEDGWSVVETSAGSYRRVVASPEPLAIIEADAIRRLVDTDTVVVAAGGGGIPVVRDDHGWHAIDAVIDKDRASAVLACEAHVDTLVLVTGVDQVYVDFGAPTQRALGVVDVEEMQEHLDAGQFPAGSMGPKVASALHFVRAGGTRAIITSLPRLHEALAGKTGTHIVGASTAPPPIAGVH